MRAGLYSSPVLFCLFAAAASVSSASSPLRKRGSDPLGIDWSPAPPPQDGPPLSADALRNPAYLPAQIGGIVGSYAFSLVLVAIGLLALAKTRRDHLRGADELDLEEPAVQFVPAGLPPYQSQTNFPYAPQSPKSPARNFSYPSPISPVTDASAYVWPSPVSYFAPGVDLQVDQSVVAADRRMAQQQLEDMYKYVMEHEDAKEAGVEPPPIPYAQSAESPRTSTTTLTKKERAKPATLNLGKEEKTQSRTSSILSALKSPRRKAPKGVSISSPIMTPMSGTFPRADGEEMNAIPPRQYAPAAPPPIPVGYIPRYQLPVSQGASPSTPDMSPQSTQSIDERIGGQLSQPSGHYRTGSTAPSEADPVSAASERSTAPLVGLPCSPKPGARFPSLPLSPKPGQTFQRSNAPSPIRTGGALPLRAYEPSIKSPTTIERHTKQTVFERTVPMSPGGGRTPFTGAPVPYSPYQPFTPVVPITPSLVTKADRKRMRRFEPKTPTVEMVRSEEDIW